MSNYPYKIVGSDGRSGRLQIDGRAEVLIDRGHTTSDDPLVVAAAVARLKETGATEGTISVTAGA